METLNETYSIAEIPDLYNASLRDISDDFDPQVAGLIDWQTDFASQEAPLEAFLKDRREQVREVLLGREQHIVAVMRDAFPMVLEASDLPKDDKELLLSVGKTMKNASPLKVEKGIKEVNENASCDESQLVLRLALDGAIAATARRADNNGKLQRCIRLAEENCSSIESLLALRQVIDARVFESASSPYAWIDLDASRKLTRNRQYSSQVGRQLIKIAHEYNVLISALNYSLHPREEILQHSTSKATKSLMFEAHRQSLREKATPQPNR